MNLVKNIIIFSLIFVGCNNKDDFIEKFSKFIQLDNKERIDIKLNAKKFTKKFSLLKHFKKIENILS